MCVGIKDCRLYEKACKDNAVSHSYECLTRERWLKTNVIEELSSKDLFTSSLTNLFYNFFLLFYKL